MRKSDYQLLREYSDNQSESAFAELVSRYIDLVYSAAHRQVQDVQLAQEVTQAVFVVLSRKAGRLGPKVVLAGWLLKTARYTAQTQIRANIRRIQREQEVAMQTLTNEEIADAWEQLTPHLDTAMSALGEKDRNAVALRYFENRSNAEIASAMKVSKDAAQKRVVRALEKLRKILSKRGVKLTAVAVAGALSTGSVQAAPAGLAITVSGVIMKGTLVSTAVLALVKGTIDIMTWTKIKTAAAVGLGISLIAGTANVASHFNDPELESYLEAPPTLLIQASAERRLPDGSPLGNGWDDKSIGRDLPLGFMLSDAYGFPQTRMVFTSTPPTNHYDWINTLTNRPRERFQALIKEQLAWVGEVEIREVDALVLQTKDPTMLGSKVSLKYQPRNSDRTKYMDWPHQPISSLASFVESTFQKPVIDKTGLTNAYDITLEGQPTPTTYLEFLKEALEDQLGLELVPSREKIEMLVIKKVK